MKIGIDVRSLQVQDRFRGIGAYVSSVVSGLARLDRNNHYLLYLWPGSDPLKFLHLPTDFKHEQVTLRKPYWRTVAERSWTISDIVISKYHVDVFLQPNAAFGLPRGDIPIVAVAYDLIPLMFQDHYFARWVTGNSAVQPSRTLRNFVGAWLYRRHYRWHLRQLLAADRIVAISHATKEDLVRNFPQIEPAKIGVVYPSCDPVFRPMRRPGAILSKLGIDRPFLLYVGSVDFRKNVGALLQAYNRIRGARCNLQLVLVGKDFLDTLSSECLRVREFVKGSEYAADIVRPGFIAREDLVDLYSSATALVFPSLYEGFGLPIIEAMACGCPVIAYRNSSIPEAGGDAALLLNPNDDLAGSILQVVNDQQLRNSMIARGLKQASRFAPDTTVAAMLAIFEELVKQDTNERTPPLCSS